MNKIIIAVIGLIILTSCNQEEDCEYYAKFDVSTTSSGAGLEHSNVYVSFNGGSGNSTDKVRHYQYSSTKGPFHKGDILYLNIRAFSHDIQGVISVSKNGSPFVTAKEGYKKGNFSKNELNLSYKIN